MEHSIAPVGAHGERLRSILKRIRWRLNPLVADWQRFPLFHQDKPGIGAIPLDGIGSDIAGYPQVAGVGLVSHALQFADGDVVALIFIHPAYREIDNGAQDDYGSGSDPPGLWSNLRHTSRVGVRLPLRQAVHLTV